MVRPLCGFVSGQIIARVNSRSIAVNSQRFGFSFTPVRFGFRFDSQSQSNMVKGS
ncbi:hypothetical protein HanXRQr2_Chr17g0816121 [Helianthus annuus]|uniref:Uncharacterized protein n=1 Tax=Helianthus annuus TaxID=4232 RepID=A0A9K3DK51_HELAN|nr:hypothetical protein HanXRQr2_Chr17g0816121 [Helianthus annuus]